MKHLSTYLAILTLAPAVVMAQQSADLVLTNGRIYTVDNARPQVSALAVRDGRVLFVGSDAEAKALAGPSTQVIDLRGAAVYPGFTDAHAHLLGLGNMLQRVNLAGSTSYDEVIERVKAWAKNVKPGEWIQGRGWDQNRWPVKEFPTHEALSRAFPSNPVVLDRIDGHALLANARAMELAHVTAATRDPAGGRIVRLASGEPSGVFVDNAKSLISRAVPEPTRANTRKAILAAVAEANRWGLTGIHDPGEGAEAVGIYEELARAGNYNLRNYVMLSDPGEPGSAKAMGNPYIQRGPQNALYDGHLWIRAIKLYADGALGSRGAALLAPYSDDPTNSGLLVSRPEHIEAWAEWALRHGFQINVHAIGDRGNRVVLDAFDSALRKIPKANHRFRIEHAQVLSPQDIPRFARLGVIPSMQATHQTSDMRWAESRVGPQRIRGAYAWRSLLNTGVIIPNGTDFPVEEVNPLLTFHAAVTRQDPTNWPAGGWYPEQKMTRQEALQSMTIWPAYAGFQESVLGSLTPGKYADFVVLDRDIMTVPDTEILAARVLSTWVGGKRVYEAK
ncbi:MAG TPA: amidohydrolase [Gemmatimonadaceae bacterium]|jgi:predicted amidohydrolase YtcJ|nr:amidohydrolase [Gemmatimonadaceae bacterium]